MVIVGFTKVEAQIEITNVPERITCPKCFLTAFRNSDVELYENRKYYLNLKGEKVYEENYKCVYKCQYCSAEISAVVELHE